MLLSTIAQTQQHGRVEDCASYQALLQRRLVAASTKLEDVEAVAMNGEANFGSIMQKLQARSAAQRAAARAPETKKRKIMKLEGQSASSGPKHVACSKCRARHRSGHYCRITKKHDAPAWNSDVSVRVLTGASSGADALEHTSAQNRIMCSDAPHQQPPPPGLHLLVQRAVCHTAHHLFCRQLQVQASRV